MALCLSQKEYDDKIDEYKMYYADSSRLRLFLERFEVSFFVHSPVRMGGCASNSTSVKDTLCRFFSFSSLLARGVSSEVGEISKPEDRSCECDETFASASFEFETSSSFVLYFFPLWNLTFLAALSASLRSLFSRVRSSSSASSFRVSSPQASILHSFSVPFCVSPGREGGCAVAVGSVLTIS